MNKNKIILAICILLAGISTAHAQSIVLDESPYSYSVGGEFTAHTSPNNLLSNYSPLAIVNGGFETFCVESTVDFNPGNTYSYVLTNTESTGQQLTLGAAYLYNQFATGKLSGYDYTDAATRQADNAQLQTAFWALQSQSIYPGFPTNLSTDQYYNLVMTNLGSTAMNSSNGAYGVDIMQLYDANGAPAQAQLALVTPEPSTIWLFIFAISLVFLLIEGK